MEQWPARLILQHVNLGGWFGRSMIRKKGQLRSLCFLSLILPLCCSIPATAAEHDGAAIQLDRIALGVEGAESSYGKNPAMWRPDPAGPQGPMQVSEKAETDVGGGNRMDVAQNRAMGRAYLALLHRRYGNWPDAIAAYNWGMGKLDGWIRAGRPSEKLLPGVAVYLQRVLRESGVSRTDIGVGPWWQLRSTGISERRDRFTSRFGPISDIYVHGLELSGRPLPVLANSGRPLPSLAQSGVPLPALARGVRVNSARNDRF